MTDPSETITKLRAQNRKLKARVAELEAILVCACGHLRSEHFENDAPCHGGREGLKSGEGNYCMCDGFNTREASHD